MEGVIEACLQLRCELDKSFNEVARRMQLDRLKLDAVEGRLRQIEGEEVEVQNQITTLLDKESACRQEAARVAKETEVQCGAFEALMKAAVDNLRTTALRRETGKLEELISQRKGKLELMHTDLTGYPRVDAVSLRAFSRTTNELVRKRDQEVARNNKLQAEVEQFLTPVACNVAVKQRADLVEAASCLELSVAVADMGLKLKKQGNKRDTFEARTKPRPCVRTLDVGTKHKVHLEKLLARLSLQRERETNIFRNLSESLKERLERNESLNVRLEQEGTRTDSSSKPPTPAPDEPLSDRDGDYGLEQDSDSISEEKENVVTGKCGAVDAEDKSCAAETGGISQAGSDSFIEITID